ncbi:MAG: PA14 domain-containing protein [Planctomycetota bacterium]|nr:PA14 domain-containing protein [Planctomycetota bacterium]MDA1138523.1 PA14 domain-containing protein [Planctomycetota bacterium]
MNRCICILGILSAAIPLSAETPTTQKPNRLKGAEFDQTAQPGFVGEYFQWPGLKNLPQIPDTTKPFYVSVDTKIDFNDSNGNFNNSKMADGLLARWTGILRVKTKEMLQESLDAIEEGLEKDDGIAVPESIRPKSNDDLRAGQYQFFLNSDDGSRLWINDKLVVDHDGLHGSTEKDGEIELWGGDYNIRIEFFESGGGASCRLLWQPPGGKKEVLPAKVMFRKNGSEKIAWDVDKWKKTKVPKPKGGGNPDAKYAKMNYGPALAATFKAEWPAGNTALKGLILRFEKELPKQVTEQPKEVEKVEGEADAEQEEAAPEVFRAGICFDTELLRYSAAWTGGWITYTGVAFNGAHGPNPGVDGELKIATQNLPGWDKDGKLEDPREIPHGPLSRDYARYKGAYYHGNKVVLSYVVGDTPVLELPGMVMAGDEVAFSRDIQYGPSSKNRTMVVCEQAGATGGIAAAGQPINSFKTGPANLVAFLEGGANLPNTNTAAVIVGTPEGATWEITDQGRILLHLSPSQKVTNFKLITWNGDKEKADQLSEVIKAAGQPEDLAIYMKGGPLRWTETVETKGTLGTGDGPYLVDTIEAPYTNPYEAWIRFGGFDFFEDGTTAALSTWSGDVWIVSGVDETLEKLTWKRFASGLFHPLGLKIVDGVIHTLGRDQITKLHDLNQDGEADFYECFNNDVMITDNFHEFAFCLETDSKGTFYFAKGGPVRPGGRGWGKVVPHHGCIMSVSKDGGKLEIFSTGSRAPNGMGVGPNDEITVGDNEGTWTPKCHISLVNKGDFLGVVDLAHGEPKPTTYAPHICWLPRHLDNSNGGQVWVTSDNRWGPLEGRMLHMSYGTTRLFLVDYEYQDGVIQGGVVPFKLNFNTGIMRGRFNKRDGQLYLCGLKGWQSSAAKEAGFQRVRYTGKPVDMATKIHYTQTGIEITFNRPVQTESIQAENFSAEMWNYTWTGAYGSADYSILNPGKHGKDKLSISSAKLSADGKTASLEIPQLQECMQWMVRYRLKTADGNPLENEVYGTINKMDKPRVAQVEAPPIAEGAIPRAGIALELESLVSTGPIPGPAVDIRSERMVSMYVPEDTNPSPFLPAGRFKATWKGSLMHQLKEEFSFSAKGMGKFKLTLNGQQVLEGNLSPTDPLKSQPVFLKNGANELLAQFESPAKGDSQVRLYWESKEFPPEPISMDRFTHDAGNPFHRGRDREREGRLLIAKYRCLNCHTDKTGATNITSFPELTKDAPSLEGIGSRLNTTWMVQWLMEPKRFRPDGTMPRLFHGEQDLAKARDIAGYLGTLQAGKPASEKTFTTVEIAGGKSLYRNLACAACHTSGEAKAFEGVTRVPHDHLASKWQPDALVEFLEKPEQHYKWTGMPNFRLSRAEAEQLAAYLLSENNSKDAEPTQGLSGGEDIVNGKKLVESSGCLNCHSLKAENTFIAPALHEIAKDKWTDGCLSEKPEVGSPFFAFSKSERESLLAFAATDWKSLARVSSPEYAQFKFKELRCLNCHSRDAHESPWADIVTPDDSKEAKDNKDADEDVEDRLSLSPPRLTWVGEKLRPDWIEKFIAGHIKYKPRPWLNARMPSFPAHAKGLAEGFALQHGLSPKPSEQPQPNAPLSEQGRKMIGATGFSCNACHSVGDKKSIGVFEAPGINFAHARDRLQKEYFLRWIAMPIRVEPETRMPQFIEYGKNSPFTSILGGDTSQQFDAMWQYLLSGEKIQAPE